MQTQKEVVYYELNILSSKWTSIVLLKYWYRNGLKEGYNFRLQNMSYCCDDYPQLHMRSSAISNYAPKNHTRRFLVLSCGSSQKIEIHMCLRSGRNIGTNVSHLTVVTLIDINLKSSSSVFKINVYLLIIFSYQKWRDIII